MGELKNCPSCGNLYVQHLRSVCDSCYTEEELMFEKVFKYMRKRENRQATLLDVHQQTGVDEEKITKFIRQGRIRVVGFPNFYYPCETCEGPTQEGRLCSSCKKKIMGDLKTNEFEAQKKLVDLGRSYYTD
ncbi:TIGR03826 family flagellar region protein [Fictibacillus sp. KU28468]|uniref:TIGR03826 family flagellar region protein n=1 Tax=Fictibacillus sp. KU28468 TaxID=2991053 RepID=UPI00223CE6AF|nr:TIGR03826 family flagellar region protein [Fictibacillus sp. KU28468]UZJ79685.1 hypothetical protein OKX00_04165 [Fictibacillus sp. KU28468]